MQGATAGPRVIWPLRSGMWIAAERAAKPTAGGMNNGPAPDMCGHAGSATGMAGSMHLQAPGLLTRAKPALQACWEQPERSWWGGSAAPDDDARWCATRYGGEPVDGTVLLGHYNRAGRADAKRHHTSTAVQE